MPTGKRQLIYVGIRGTVLALDRSTGEEVWRTKLKGYEFVNLMLDGADLLASARGELFCLDPGTGRIRWNNPLKGLGWGIVSIATAAGSTNPAPAARQRQTEATQASAAGGASVACM